MLVGLTISLDERLLERLCEVARQQATSVDALILRCLEELAGARAGDDVADELLGLMNEHGGHSGGQRITRDDAYEGRA